MQNLQKEFEGSAIISFKKDFEEPKLPAKTLEEHTLSVQELGKKILAENLQAAGLDPQRFEAIFELLLEKKIERAQEMLYKP